MKKQNFVLMLLLLVVVAVPLFAQSGDGADVLYPDYGNIGGGGGSVCYTCAQYLWTNQVYCQASQAVAPEDGYNVVGYFSCTAHNVQIGPGYCEVSGRCVGIAASSSSRDAFEQEQHIVSYLLHSALISPDDLSDFIATAEDEVRNQPSMFAEQNRLAAYRAKFKSVVGRGLAPGTSPVLPERPIRTHTAAAL